MKDPHYTDAIRHAWHLARQHTYLWVLGIFAAMIGQFGLSSVISNAFSAAASPTPYFFSISSVQFHVPSALFSGEGAVLLIWLLVTLGALGIGLLVVSIVSQAAIVQAAASWFGRKKLPEASDVWHDNMESFWPLLGLLIVKTAALAIVPILITLGAYVAVDGGFGSSMLFLVLFLLATTVGMVVTFLHMYAIGYIVVERYRFFDSIIAAYRLFSQHWLVSFEVGVLLLGVGLLSALVAFAGLPLFMLPAIIMWYLALQTGSFLLYALGVLVGGLLFLAFLFLVGAVYTVLSTSAWTYLFMKMHKHGLTSRIAYYLGRR